MITPGTLLTAPSAGTESDAAFLRANSDAYETLVARVEATDWRRKPELALARITAAARAATAFYAGRFADGALENVALGIGRRMTPPPHTRAATALRPAAASRRQVLHVASCVMGIGGHTRMLYRWICDDTSSCHSIALLHQGKLPVPSWLAAAVKAGGGSLVSFPTGGPGYEKAAALREIAGEIADLVVLHHGGWDVVPTVAFATASSPPVAVLNHADHEFWLGSSVADIVINLRTAAVAHTRERRFVACNTVLPVPLWDRPAVSRRAEARRALGMSNRDVVLLSVARAEKFRAHGRYDFIATAGRLLERNERAHLFVVGASAADLSRVSHRPLPDRLHALGSIEDPWRCHCAADVFLETFPFGSQTSVLEAAKHGIPIVPAYSPLFALLVANDDALSDLLINPGSESEYLERAEALIRDPVLREHLAVQLQQRVRNDHVGEGWCRHLERVYRETDHLKHSPHHIRRTRCATGVPDVGLSQWRIVADGRTMAADYQQDVTAAADCHRAYLAREMLGYADAIRTACRALWHRPFRCCAWRLMAVNAIGRGGRWLRLGERLIRCACSSSGLDAEYRH